MNGFRGLSWKSISVQYSVTDCLDLLTLFTLCGIVSNAVITVASHFPRLKWKRPSFYSGSAVVDQLAGCCYCKGFWISFIILLLHSIGLVWHLVLQILFNVFFSPLSHTFSSCRKQAVLLVSRQETAWKDRKNIKKWVPIRREPEYHQLCLGRYYTSGVAIRPFSAGLSEGICELLIIQLSDKPRTKIHQFWQMLGILWICLLEESFSQLWLGRIPPVPQGQIQWAVAAAAIPGMVVFACCCVGMIQRVTTEPLVGKKDV